MDPDKKILFKHGRYIVYDEKLGSGTFGDVYSGYDTDKQREIAAKRISSGLDLSRKEIDALQRLKEHDNIVRMFGYFQREGQHWVITQLLSGPTLDTYMESNPNTRVRFELSEQLIEAVQYLHNNNPPIIHRDLKPLNILVVRGHQLKLIDFGLAFHVNETLNATTFGGTLNYMAPELFQDGNYNASCVDIFATGLLILAVTTFQQGKKMEHLFAPVFTSAIGQQMLQNRDVLTRRIDGLRYSNQQTMSLVRLAKCMVSFEPDSRPDMNSVYRAFKRIMKQASSPDFQAAAPYRSEVPDTLMFPVLVRPRVHATVQPDRGAVRRHVYGASTALPDITPPRTVPDTPMFPVLVRPRDHPTVQPDRGAVRRHGYGASTAPPDITPPRTESSPAGDVPTSFTSITHHKLEHKASFIVGFSYTNDVLLADKDAPNLLRLFHFDGNKCSQTWEKAIPADMKSFCNKAISTDGEIFLQKYLYNSPTVRYSRHLQQLEEYQREGDLLDCSENRDIIHRVKIGNTHALKIEVWNRRGTLVRTLQLPTGQRGWGSTLSMCVTRSRMVVTDCVTDSLDIFTLTGEHVLHKPLPYTPADYKAVTRCGSGNYVIIAAYCPPDVHVYNVLTGEEAATFSYQQLGLSEDQRVQGVRCCNGVLHIATGGSYTAEYLHAYKVQFRMRYQHEKEKDARALKAQ